MKISIAVRSIIGDWLHYYWPTLIVLLVLALFAYFIYRFMYIRKMNKILKKEEKPKKLLPIEYFTFITLIFSLLSLRVRIGVDKYIHRDIKINMSTNLMNLNIKNVYEQLDEYSKKDRKIKVERDYQFLFNIDNNYNILNQEIDVLVPKPNKYSKYCCDEINNNNNDIITFKCVNKEHITSSYNYYMDVEDFYSQIDIANEYLIEWYSEYDFIENEKTLFILSFNKTKFKEEFENINILNQGKVESYTYSGKYIEIIISTYVFYPDSSILNILNFMHYYIF